MTLRNSKRITDFLATVAGIGVFAAGVVALVNDWPVGTAFMLFVAGGALLPFISVPGRGNRPVIVVLAFAVAMATPLYSDFVVKRQIQGAYRGATEAAARLAEVAKQKGHWPSAPADFPDKLEPVQGDGYSRDIQVKDCRGASCTLVVTFTDHDYATSIRGRHFALWTKDGGRTWTCGPTRLYPLAPKDLPEACQPTGAH